MSKLFWRAIKALPLIVAGSLVATDGTLAQSLNQTEVDSTLQQINRYQDSGSNRSMSQVTNVNQLRDVSPSDWAYEALRSLVDRYGCIVGYPNQTFRGNRALSRYEFAAGLNACLNQIERLIASSEAILREDIDALNRLLQEFEAELATLGGRVDNLESRTAFLEDHQFSTTTKLKGEVIFSLADTFGDVRELDDAGNRISEDDPTETTFSDRVRLNFDTSFYGRDRLRTRLEAGNVPNFADDTGFDSTRVGYDFDNGNDVEITDLHYLIPVGDKFRGWIGASGLDIDEIFEPNNPILESSGTGALSRFSRRDPITLRGAEGTGIGANYEINDMFTVSALYLTETDNASNPSTALDPVRDQGNGIFNGSFTTGVQLVVEPIEPLKIALTYTYEYLQIEAEVDDDGNLESSRLQGGGLSGATSSALAKNPFSDNLNTPLGANTSAHQVGLSVTWEFADRFVLGAFGSGSFARALESDTIRNNFFRGEKRDAILYSTGINFSVLDLGKEGAALSVAAGIPPRLVKNEGGLEDEDTNFLLELLYKYPINDNILITPGGYVVINPGGNSDNDTQFVGVIRTTFQF